MADDVVEIPPPIPPHARAVNRKEAKLCNVIEIDDDEDTVGLKFFNEVVTSKNKGKEKVGDNLIIEENGVASSKSFNPTTPNVINLDDQSSDASCDDYDDTEDYMNSVSETFMDIDDYAILQSHFDNSDIPTGVEASIPFLLNPLETGKNPVPGSKKKTDITGRRNKKLVSGSKYFHTKSSSSLSNRSDLPADSGSKKKVASLQIKGVSVNTPLSKSGGRRQSQVKKKQIPEFDSESHSNSPKISYAKNVWEPYNSGLFKETGPIGLGSSKIPPHLNSTSKGSFVNFMGKIGFPDQWNTSNYPNGGSHFIAPENSYFAPGVGFAEAGPGNTAPVNKIEVLKKFQSFKQFESVEDHSDHHYTSKGSPLKQPTKKWTKQIQEEWKILEKDLPDTIFVRVYESRMDIMRFVIVGAEGTPYHDGLFFFDVFFPHNYPNVPPNVYYHSGGLRLNPNLYDNGYVCLSLLNTWTGGKEEMWIPGKSTMLQVLVSIQGLILNAKPYFNEPGYAPLSGKPSGEKKSLEYNENTFILSLKTMSYSIRRPPKHFEDLVAGHFLQRGLDVLVACKAYMEGAQVGCLVKGGVQDVDEGDKGCSEHFKNSLKSYMKLLVPDFSRIGVEGCDKFLTPPPAAASSRAALAGQ